MSHSSRFALAGGLAAFASIGLVCEAQAQAFADVKTAQVDYSKADSEPRVSCEQIAKYQSRDIAEIHATMIAAEGATASHCRVSGVLKPEIAFEVSLPQHWNGRLVVWAHGYRGTGTTVYVDNPPLRAHYLADGFAWAASSYATNGYDVGQGVRDSYDLIDLFDLLT